MFEGVLEIVLWKLKWLVVESGFTVLSVRYSGCTDVQTQQFCSSNFGKEWAVIGGR